MHHVVKLLCVNRHIVDVHDTLRFIDRLATDYVSVKVRILQYFYGNVVMHRSNDHFIELKVWVSL